MWWRGKKEDDEEGEEEQLSVYCVSCTSLVILFSNFIFRILALGALSKDMQSRHYKEKGWIHISIKVLWNHNNQKQTTKTSHKQKYKINDN